uniref:Metallo-beta-lactamase domain-containing protein n=1 Tax=Brassica oleracea TaxID=3712 RepID=A0A3P6BBI8_BRAOL|nr:unnamed protein product [Brassica oleracea]
MTCESQVMKKTHYYLVDTSVIIPGAAVSDWILATTNDVGFVVGLLDMNSVFKLFQIIPLPVSVAWNDVSDIPEETYPLLKDCDLLIMDALRPDRSSATHFGLPRALEEVQKIKPERTLFTGMMHLMDHEKVSEEELEKLMDTEGIDVKLSYDGLRIPVSI